MLYDLQEDLEENYGFVPVPNPEAVDE